MATIYKQGSGSGIHIPTAIMKAVGLSDGDRVDIITFSTLEKYVQGKTLDNKELDLLCVLVTKGELAERRKTLETVAKLAGSPQQGGDPKHHSKPYEVDDEARDRINEALAVFSKLNDFERDAVLEQLRGMTRPGQS